MKVGSKIHYKQINEIRRFQICSFSDLEKKSREVFSRFFTNIQEIIYQYLDAENDWVNFSSQEEYEQAIKFYNKEKNVLMVNVHAKYIKSQPFGEEFAKEFHKFVEKIPENVDKFVKSIPGAVDDMVKEIPKKVEEIKREFPKKVEQIKKDIPKKVDKLKKDIKEIEKELPNKVEEIRKGVEKYTNKGKDLANKVVNFLTDPLDSETNPSIHKRVICDRCKCTPIIGKRYKSLNRKNFDLCETCFEKRNDSGLGEDSFDVYEVRDKIAQTIIASDKSDEKYKIQLDLLYQMGFRDKVGNTNLLIKHKGNLQRVVQEIIKS